MDLGNCAHQLQYLCAKPLQKLCGPTSIFVRAHLNNATDQLQYLCGKCFPLCVWDIPWPPEAYIEVASKTNKGHLSKWGS